jgi:hypothetical protein
MGARASGCPGAASSCRSPANHAEAPRARRLARVGLAWIDCPPVIQPGRRFFVWRHDGHECPSRIRAFARALVRRDYESAERVCPRWRDHAQHSGARNEKSQGSS